MSRVGELKDRARSHPSARYVVNTGWLLAGRFLGFPINLVMAALVARYLGVDSFGELSFAAGLVALFASVAALGLDNIVVREVVRNPESEPVITGTALLMRVVAGALFTIAIIIGAKLALLPDREYWILVITSLSLVFLSSAVLKCYFEAKVRAKFVAQAMLGQIVVSAMLKTLLILFEARLEWFAVVLLVDSMVLFFILFRFYRHEAGVPGPGAWRFEFDTAISLLSSSWPFMAQAVALTVYMKLDQLMIRVMLGVEEVGIYSAAVRISESWLVIAVILTTSLYPALISAQQKSEQLFRELLADFYSLMFWCSIFLAVPIALFSDTIIILIFGREFAEAGEVLAVHAWSGICVFMITASSRWYLAINRERSILYRALLGAITNILLNYLLIPTYGVVGAAYATLISYALMAVLYDLLDPTGRPSLGLKFSAVFRPFVRLRSALN